MAETTTVRKPRFNVPKVTRALFRVALRVANGGGSPGDKVKVRKAVPGHPTETAARVIVLRWLWHQDDETKWHA